MAHESYINLMNLSLEGLLSQQEEYDLQDHIAGCSACATTYSRLQAVEMILHTPIMIAPPPQFSAGVMARIARYEADKVSRPWLQALLIMIIVLSIIAFSVPVVGVTLGLHKQVIEYPLVNGIMTQLDQFYTQLSDLIGAGVNRLFASLSYALTDPLTLGLVIVSLVAISTYVGLREAMRSTPVGEIATQKI